MGMVPNFPLLQPGVSCLQFEGFLGAGSWGFWMGSRLPTVVNLCGNATFLAPNRISGIAQKVACDVGACPAAHGWTMSKLDADAMYRGPTGQLGGCCGRNTNIHGKCTLFHSFDLFLRSSQGLEDHWTPSKYDRSLALGFFTIVHLHAVLPPPFGSCGFRTLRVSAYWQSPPPFVISWHLSPPR